MRIHWELKGNIVGTHWELGKNEKKIFPPSPPHPQTKSQKEKKKGTLSACLGLPIGLSEISLPKRVRHHFWPGLIPSAKNTLGKHIGNLMGTNWEL
jgi:hypothetical protein